MTRLARVLEAMKKTRPSRKIPAVPLCITTLLNDRKGPAWEQGHMKAASWIRVVQTPYFSDEGVLRRSILIYDAMERGTAYCPTVTTYRGSLKIEYEHEGRVAVFLLDPGQSRFGMGIRGEPYELVSGPIDEETVATLARWVGKGESA